MSDSLAATQQTRLTALVVARNEAAQLADCLACLGFADEILVQLDRSEDASAEIARAAGARVLEGAWPDEGQRRNAGREAALGAWILEIDADERVPPELAAEIGRVLEAPTAEHYFIPFDNYVGDRRVRYGWGAYWGVSAAPRLTRRAAKRWRLDPIHPGYELEGRRAWLEGRIAHYVDRDVSDMLARLDRYTDAEAGRLIARGVEESLGRNLRRLVSRFWKCFVTRKGYREGADGVLIALFAGLYPLLAWYKARERRLSGTATSAASRDPSRPS